jgi:plastocyanin
MKLNQLLPGRRIAVLLLGVSVLAGGCTAAAASGSPPTTSAATVTATAYQPRTRSFVLTTMPIAVHEMQASMDYLQKDFAAGGILDGKEVYGFYPSTLVVYQGDTVDLTLVNPQDDPHTFTIADLGVNVEMKGQSTTRASFVARTPGIYQFVCAESEHAPYMWGELVVLPDQVAH